MRKGDLIDRNIEGQWFGAVIENVDIKNKYFTVRYLDDGNVEENVPSDEIRASISPTASANTTGKRETLLKPLAGLVEDDSESRNEHQPTVILHSDTESENAIIINGAENRLAVGGGLRALRYLKH